MSDAAEAPYMNLAAERALLACLIMDPDARDRLGGLLSSSDFSLRFHGVLYERLADPDLPHSNALESAFELVGPGRVYAACYLEQLTAETPTAINLLSYARILVRLAALREQWEHQMQAQAAR